jgi:5-methylcytosine-specific restriction enzyme subunit McrC
VIPVRNLYYLLCYAWDSVEEVGSVDVEELERFDRIEDLFGLILAQGVSRLATRGLDRSYVSFEEELAAVRGKIEIAATIKRTSLLRHRLVCSFEDLSADVIHNQILASTLDILSGHSPLHPEVKKHVRLAASRLRGVSIQPLTTQMFSKVQLDRNRRAYRFLINVCRLLHGSRLVCQTSGASRFADMDLERLKMWQVFERFAARFYDRETPDYRVRPQTHIQWWGIRPLGLSSVGRIPLMKPDLLLEGRDRRIILDTKYYKDGGLGHEDNSKLHSGDLYQLFAYVINRQRKHSEGVPHEGILLYPTVGDETRVEFMTHGHRFQARSIDLSMPWQEIHGAMLGVLE